jgi:maltooligosyltrehalose trehalohydrolase
LADITSAARSQKNAVLIAETHEDDVRYVQPVAAGGYGFDAVYADDFHHIVRRYVAGDHEGYYARYQGTLDELAQCIERGWLRGTPTLDQPPWRFLYCIQNHDQVGNRACGERLNHDIDLERYTAASALLLFLPFTPLLFMGQEFAASTPFQYFTDHNPELGRLVTEGRRREFKAFSAFADAASRERIPDPQAESTFLKSKLRLSEAGQPPGSDVQAWYQRLLDLRRTDPVLVDQSRERMEPRALSADVLAVRRWRDTRERVLIVNFGDTVFEASELGEGWRPMLGRGDARHVSARSALILGRDNA